MRPLPFAFFGLVFAVLDGIIQTPKPPLRLCRMVCFDVVSDRRFPNHVKFRFVRQIHVQLSDPHVDGPSARGPGIVYFKIREERKAIKKAVGS